MPDQHIKSVLEIIKKNRKDILNVWKNNLWKKLEYQRDLLSDNEIDKYTEDFLNLFNAAIKSGDFDFMSSEEWDALKDMVTQLIHRWSSQGFTIRETASFVTTFKNALYNKIKENIEKNPDVILSVFSIFDRLFTDLAIFSVEAHVLSRDEIISRQQKEILELSTPVVTLWKGILAIPLIGTLDSERTQMVMEALLQKIVETGSDMAIIDITGVPAVDTEVAQHIIKTINAARLMGADCIISGIRPQIAQTMVALGVSFDVTTKATLADAFSVALKRVGFQITNENHE